MAYGKKPKELGVYNIECNEMMFYQYLPIKLIGDVHPVFEKRLNCFSDLIGVTACDFIASHGLNNYIKSFMYLTVKTKFQTKCCPLNREGYHADGFMTEDINYIWSNNTPTIFNNSSFQLSMDDNISMVEMEKQALVENEFTYPDKTLLKLDQYVIHKAGSPSENILRTFVKISFSKDKYNLKGNSINYLVDYKWVMRDRSINRNIPQELNQ